MTSLNLQSFEIDIDYATSIKWDVVVIGSGMGGGSTAYSLSKSGHKVLIIEKGLLELPDSKNSKISQSTEDPNGRLLRGRWPNRVASTIDGREFSMWPEAGCGVGGTTLLYAAALQRFDHKDFEQYESIPKKSNPGAWPFNYKEIEPYYQQAEVIFKVTGSSDPLETNTTYNIGLPNSISESDLHIFNEMEKVKLHPYRIHVGIEYKTEDVESVDYYGTKQSKSDSRNCCIIPGFQTGNLFILTETEAIKFDADENTVNSIQVHHKNTLHCINAKTYILSTGALFTPGILQRSTNKYWPNGIGNNFDMVGRNLMFHASDFLALWTRSATSAFNPQKSIALRDFYSYKGQKLGEIQSTGLKAGFSNILYYLYLKFYKSIFGKYRFLRHILRIPAYIASRFLKEAAIFATIVEDYPYSDNRILIDSNSDSGIRVEYRIRKELKDRVNLLRKLFLSSLNGVRCMKINESVTLNYGHPCGTCRCGTNSSNSVLDNFCRIHGIDNLYVLDASFMPTSGGTNPSLTIAANALRVADFIDIELRRTSD